MDHMVIVNDNHVGRKPAARPGRLDHLNDTFKTEAEAKMFLDKEPKRTGHPATSSSGGDKK